MATELDINQRLQGIADGIEKNTATVREYKESHDSKLAETNAVVEKINTEFADLASNYKKLSEELQLVKSLKAATSEQNTEEARVNTNEALRTYLKNNMNINAVKEELRPYLKNSMTTVQDGDGGITVPQTLETEIFKALYNEPGMRQLVVARPMSSMESKPLTMGQVNSYWVAEEAEITATQAALGGVVVKAHKLGSLVIFSNELLEDSAVDLLSELSMAIGMSVAENEDIAFIRGTGATSPRGLLTSGYTASGKYTASGVAGVISNSSNNGIDKLRLLVAVVKGGHRSRGKWTMNATTSAVVRNLKDTNGQYLYHWDVAAGGAPTFDGYPIYINDNMPDIAANAFPIAFGDFNAGYVIRDRRGITATIDRTTLAHKDQTRMIVTKRVGGEPVITETPAVRLLKIATS